MHVDLVESLRCVRPHELTWLVAVADLVEGRDIVRGVLGCPECGAEYPIAGGVADFRSGEPRASLTSTLGGGDLALRAAALLDLTAPGGLVVLAGAWGSAARELLALVDGVHVLALNGPPELASGGGLSLAVASDDIPLRPAVSRGIALDEANGAPSQVAAAVAALRAGGRLVAPTTAPLPEGVALLAADERHWAAERRTPREPVVRLAVSRGGAR